MHEYRRRAVTMKLIAKAMAFMMIIGVVGVAAVPAADAVEFVDVTWRPANTGRTHNAYFYINEVSDHPQYCNVSSGRIKARVKINYRRSGNNLKINYVAIKNLHNNSRSRVTLAGHGIMDNSAGVYSRGWGINTLRYGRSDRINKGWFGSDYSSFERIRADRSYLSFSVADGHGFCSARFNLFIVR